MRLRHGILPWRSFEGLVGLASLQTVGDRTAAGNLDCRYAAFVAASIQRGPACRRGVSGPDGHRISVVGLYERENGVRGTDATLRRRSVPTSEAVACCFESIQGGRSRRHAQSGPAGAPEAVAQPELCWQVWRRRRRFPVAGWIPCL